jgi:parallel beta-helix repeat protein
MKPFLFLVFLFISRSGAALYYVDYVNGKDASAGADTALSWQHAPGDDRATASAKHAALKPGDTVIFKGGAVYFGTITVRWRGRQASPIVYDGNSSNKWGSGKAIIDGAMKRLYGFFADDPLMASIVISNFEIRNMAYNPTMPWGSGKGIFFNAIKSGIVSGCFVHDIGYWNNDGSLVPSGNGIKMLLAGSCIVTGCEITRCGESGIWLDGAQNCLISQNNIHDYVNWGIDLSGGGRLCANNTISDNTIHDLYQFDNGFWKGTGDPPHQDFIFIRMGNGTHPVNNIVERNLLYNNYTFTDFGGTAMMFLSYADSTVVRNNIFINAHSYSAAFFGWTSTGTRFYNNTVYCPRTGAVRLETNGNNDVRNNIFICNSSGVTYENASDEKNLLFDNNFYSMPVDDKMFAMAKPWAGWNFTAWQARGYDTHSRLAASTTNLKFVSTAGYPMQCQTMDLHLSGQSPCIDAGCILKGFSEDKDKAPRFQGTAWDCGAYEFTNQSINTDTPSAPVLISPENRSKVNPARVLFRWEKSIDTTGDSVSYALFYSTDRDFSGALPVTASMVNSPPPHEKHGQKKTALLALGIFFVLLSIALVIWKGPSIFKNTSIVTLLFSLWPACSPTGPPPQVAPVLYSGLSMTVDGLDGSETYYWKVVAKNSRNAQKSSDVGSFVTE